MHRKLKIYLDDGFASEYGGGIGTYSNLLYFGLKSQGYEVIRAQHPLLRRLKPRLLRRAVYVLYLNIFLPVVLKAQRVDIAHFTNGLLPFWRIGQVRYVATVHDISPIIYPATVPATYLTYYRALVERVMKQSDHVITVSRTTKEDLNRRFDTSQVSISVCPIGLRYLKQAKPGAGSLSPAFALSKKEYFLFVGRIEKRKNLNLLLSAYEMYRQQKPDGKKLVLVGSKGHEAESVLEKRRQSNFADDIVLTGYVTESEKTLLYANAAAFVFPSLYEGFGIPLLEAVMYKLPIVLSDIPTNKEIVGSQGLYFEVQNAVALKKSLLEIENRKQEPEYSDIINRFTLNAMIESHLKAYFAALGDSDSASLEARTAA